MQAAARPPAAAPARTAPTEQVGVAAAAPHQRPLTPPRGAQLHAVHPNPSPVRFAPPPTAKAPFGTAAAPFAAAIIEDEAAAAALLLEAISKLSPGPHRPFGVPSRSSTPQNYAAKHTAQMKQMLAPGPPPARSPRVSNSGSLEGAAPPPRPRTPPHGEFSDTVTPLTPIKHRTCR